MSVDNCKEDSTRLGHTYMTSTVQHKSIKCTSVKSLPLSIANILGHLDSDSEKVEKKEKLYSSNTDEEEEEKNGQNSNADVEIDIEGDVSNQREDERGDQTDLKPSESGIQNPEKQSPSYTAIIAQAILSAPDKKLPLGSIYDYIAENFPEFLKKGQGWRNCVRHNLSLSECFIKAGRARNGRGNYWGIHPRYLKNFSKGDFRKRRASHRPRNRDLSIGYNTERLNYSHFLNPFVIPSTHPGHHPGAGQHRSFSVESLLSPERGYSAFDNYRCRLSKAEASRMPGLCSPAAAPNWLEQHKPVQHEHFHRGFLERDVNLQTPCSCRMYCWTRA